MSELVANCPRCNANQITFDLLSEIQTYVAYEWKLYFEAFCICRACKRSTVFNLSLNKIEEKDFFKKNKLSNYPNAVNRVMNIEGYICLKDFATKHPPDYLPKDIEAVFKEGAACYAIGCYNAAATMFRLCIDLSTKPMLPTEEVTGLTKKQRRDLGLRLPWLFDNGKLPETLRGLSTCIKEDGNDGAHQGTIKNEDAADILDFTYVMLERIHTEPKRIEIAEERRKKRREPKS